MNYYTRDMNFKSYIRDIPDFPIPGITFRDLTPLWRDHNAYNSLIRRMCEFYLKEQIDIVAGIEARGFLMAGPIALALGKGVVPVRKSGKLPYATIGADVVKEYGSDRLELHNDAIMAESNVLVVDDVLATGGTAAAAGRLVKELGGRPQYCFAVELKELKGREKLDGNVFSLIQY